MRHSTTYPPEQQEVPASTFWIQAKEGHVYGYGPGYQYIHRARKRKENAGRQCTATSIQSVAKRSKEIKCTELEPSQSMVQELHSWLRLIGQEEGQELADTRRVWNQLTA